MAGYGISRVAYRKPKDWPIFPAESGFDLTHVGPGKVFVLAFRQRREIP